jgi:GMP synthase (glutamine-hydrolysing)
VTLRFLVADCEPADARARRVASVGRTNGDTYADLLAVLAPGAAIEQATPGDAGGGRPDADALAGYDGVCLTGSPLHVYQPTPEVERQIAFMRDVFAAGTPSFGSCAGLQLACVAAGGKVAPLTGASEAGFARRIWPTDAGRDHPLLRGRPPAFDAPAIHGDAVERLPDGAVHLAANLACPVQAAEIRRGPGTFWGVQYHPELTLFEVAAALRRDADTLLEDGLARNRADIDEQTAAIEALGREPERLDLQWRLGLNRQVAVDELRHTEVRNFVDHLVRPTAAARGR